MTGSSVAARPARMRANRSGRTFASLCIVATRYDPRSSLSRSSTVERSRAIGEKRLARALVRAEEQRRASVHRNAVALLGHLEIPAAKPRLDVSGGDGALGSRLGARKGRVRVAVDERPVGPLARNGLCDRG